MTDDAQDQALAPAARRLLVSARRREREDELRLRLKAELDALLAAPLVAPKKRASR